MICSYRTKTSRKTGRLRASRNCIIIRNGKEREAYLVACSGCPGTGWKRNNIWKPGIFFFQPVFCSREGNSWARKRAEQKKTSFSKATTSLKSRTCTMTKHYSSNLMGGTPCKCATKCSIVGLRLWNSSLIILFHTLTRNWQDLLRWPIQFPHFNHSYDGARLLQQKCCLIFHMFLYRNPVPRANPALYRRSVWILISPCSWKAGGQGQGTDWKDFKP